MSTLLHLAGLHAATLPDVDEDGVVDSGPSRRGWSRISAAFMCYQRYAWEHVCGYGEHWGGPGPTRGSLGHTAMAQIHARWMCEQLGVSPDRYTWWTRSLESWCRKNPRGWEWRDTMVKVVEAYLDRDPRPPGRRLIGVEHQYTAVVGWMDGAWCPRSNASAQQFGLWLVRQDAADAMAATEAQGGFCREDTLPHWYGGVIRAHKLNCPEHRAHGRVIDITRRLDLEFEAVDGSYWISDHKFLSRVSNATPDGYKLDGQFAAARAMGYQRYRDKWGGTMLNAVQTMAQPFKILRAALDPVPWADRSFPSDIVYRENEVARLEVACPDGRDWPRLRSELGCTHRYGDCEGQSLCWGGPT